VIRQTMTDPFRALCAELLDELQALRRAVADELGCPSPEPLVVHRAIAALAQPESAPTNEELLELMPETMRDEFSYAAKVCSDATGSQVNPGIFRVCLNHAALKYARVALAKWGRPAIQPVPVSERLPGPEDCDKQGNVWAWRVYRPQDDDDGDFWMQIPAKWLSHIPFSSSWSHWLPAHALPTPEVFDD
jgi:hypothetical protein